MATRRYLPTGGQIPPNRWPDLALHRSDPRPPRPAPRLEREMQLLPHATAERVGTDKLPDAGDPVVHGRAVHMQAIGHGLDGAVVVVELLEDGQELAVPVLLRDQLSEHARGL